jgi:adenine-specific DNA-methyltransferase
MADNNWLDIKGYANNWRFKTENSEILLRRIIETLSKNKEYILDYFVGSGTSCSVAQKMNRKWIGIEMGGYFDSVLKIRLLHVLNGEQSGVSKEIGWKGGGMFKYLNLESYDDTLNNLELRRTEKQKNLLNNEKFYEEYLLNYFLNLETKESLLNKEEFRKPFDYQIKTTSNNEVKYTNVDLVETFNYLIGLIVESMQIIREYVVVTGTNLQDEYILIIWRDLDKHDNEALNEFFRTLQINPKDQEFDRIYVNGDNNLENLRTSEDNWKVVLIEEEFHRRMFEEVE